MKVTLIQPQQFLNQKEKNLTHLEKLILQNTERSDLIILPESLSTGFSNETKKLAEPMDGPTLQRIKKLAKVKKSTICGSLIIKEKNKYFNRFVFVRPNGKVEQYDKRHLFSMSNEAQFTSPGKEKILINYKGFKIAPFICYDLRFPVRSRNTKNYDLAIYVANRPDKRITHRQTFLQARAIENQCFVIGVNAVGKLEENRTNGGSSILVDPWGKIVYQASEKKEEIKTLEIKTDTLKEYRKTFPVLKDQDNFKFLNT